MTIPHYDPDLGEKVLFVLPFLVRAILDENLGKC